MFVSTALWTIPDSDFSKIIVHSGIGRILVWKRSICVREYLSITQSSRISQMEISLLLSQFWIHFTVLLQCLSKIYMVTVSLKGLLIKMYLKTRIIIGILFLHRMSGPNFFEWQCISSESDLGFMAISTMSFDKKNIQKTSLSTMNPLSSGLCLSFPTRVSSFPCF